MLGNATEREGQAVHKACQICSLPLLRVLAMGFDGIHYNLGLYG